MRGYPRRRGLEPTSPGNAALSRARQARKLALGGQGGKVHGRIEHGQAIAEQGSPAASGRATARQFGQAQGPSARPCCRACVRASGRGQFERKTPLSVFLPALSRKSVTQGRLRRKGQLSPQTSINAKGARTAWTASASSAASI